jgi:hypothetical protein
MTAPWQFIAMQWEDSNTPIATRTLWKVINCTFGELDYFKRRVPRGFRPIGRPKRKIKKGQIDLLQDDTALARLLCAIICFL